MFCGRAQGVHSRHLSRRGLTFSSLTFWSLKTRQPLIGVLPVGQLGYPSLTPTASHAGLFITQHLFPLASCVSHDSAQPGIPGSSAGLIDKVIERVLPLSWAGNASCLRCVSCVCLLLHLEVAESPCLALTRTVGQPASEFNTQRLCGRWCLLGIGGAGRSGCEGLRSWFLLSWGD